MVLTTLIQYGVFYQTESEKGEYFGGRLCFAVRKEEAGEVENNNQAPSGVVERAWTSVELFFHTSDKISYELT